MKSTNIVGFIALLSLVCIAIFLFKFTQNQSQPQPTSISEIPVNSSTSALSSINATVNSTASSTKNEKDPTTQFDDRDAFIETYILLIASEGELKDTKLQKKMSKLFSKMKATTLGTYDGYQPELHPIVLDPKIIEQKSLADKKTILKKVMRRQSAEIKLVYGEDAFSKVTWEVIPTKTGSLEPVIREKESLKEISEDEFYKRQTQFWKEVCKTNNFDYNQLDAFLNGTSKSDEADIQSSLFVSLHSSESPVEYTYISKDEAFTINLIFNCEPVGAYVLEHPSFTIQNSDDGWEIVQGIGYIFTEQVRGE